MIILKITDEYCISKIYPVFNALIQTVEITREIPKFPLKLFYHCYVHFGSNAKKKSTQFSSSVLASFYL
jgi:hypothetical protein